MTQKDGIVTNNFGTVRADLYEAKRAISDEMCDRAVELAKKNAPRDTSFYADNIYAMHGGASGRPQIDEIRMSRRTGRRVKRRGLAVPGVPADESAIVASASYAFIIERRHNTIGDAVRQTSTRFPSVVALIKKKYNLE